MMFPVLPPGFLAQTCPDCNGEGVVCSGVGRDQWPPMECHECGGDGTVIREDIVAVALGDVINLVRDEMANVSDPHDLGNFMDRLTREYGVRA